jgi:hypothetical protein
VRTAEPSPKKPAAEKHRGTAAVPPKSATMKLAPVEPPRRVEKLVIGGVDTRFKR